MVAFYVGINIYCNQGVTDMSIIAGFMVPHPPMIIPDIGGGDEKRIQKTIDAYTEVGRRIAELKPDTIIISSPHSVMYADYFHISPGESAKGDFGGFRAPQVSFNETYDRELADTIVHICENEEFPAGFMGERDKTLDHGTMVPLYFIHKFYDDFKLIRVGLSGLPLTEHYKLGRFIARGVNKLDRRVVFVASGDLSHKLQKYGPYGFAQEGPEYDDRIMEVMGSSDFGQLFDFSEAFCDKAAECGHRSFVIMAGAFDGVDVKSEALSHEDVTGVGYGICAFYPGEPSDDRYFLEQYFDKKQSEIESQRSKEDVYVTIARRALEAHIRDGVTVKPEDVCPDIDKTSDAYKELFGKSAGAFVSIHKDGRLRGCIGTISPLENCVASELVRNAISAATSDPRFDPILPEELDSLEYSVDVLGEPEPISGPDELDVKRYGVIVTKGFRRGLLLPDLEGVDTVEDQIDIARRKGGIGEHEKYKLERFEVIRHH